MALMKKALPFLLLLATACSTQKGAVDNQRVLRAHRAPLKISNIGYWGQNYSVLTILDANNKYFTIRTLRNDSVKVGDVYQVE
jgi:hypothetical protein